MFDGLLAAHLLYIFCEVSFSQMNILHLLLPANNHEVVLTMHK